MYIRNLIDKLIGQYLDKVTVQSNFAIGWTRFDGNLRLVFHCPLNNNQTIKCLLDEQVTKDPTIHILLSSPILS